MSIYRPRKSFISNTISNPTSLTLIGLIVLILISIPLLKNIRKQITINKEITTLEKEIDDLEGKNTELKGLISYLNSDEFTEEQARLNLNYKKEGEQVLVIKDKEGVSNGQTDKDGSDESPKSIYSLKGLDNMPKPDQENNFKKWLAYFLN